VDKIKRVSRRFRILFQFLFYITPAMIVWFWLSIHGAFDIFSQFGIGSEFFVWPTTLNGLTRFLGIMASILPASIFMYSVHQLIKIFRHYEEGDIFSTDNANRYKKLAYALFAQVIGGLFYKTLMSLVMTFQNTGAGQKIIAINVDGMDFVVLITGGIILLIAWVMTEAQKVSEDQSFTV